jgi:hypothetical protein
LGLAFVTLACFFSSLSRAFAFPFAPLAYAFLGGIIFSGEDLCFLKNILDTYSQ